MISNVCMFETKWFTMIATLGTGAEQWFHLISTQHLRGRVAAKTTVGWSKFCSCEDTQDLFLRSTYFCFAMKPAVYAKEKIDTPQSNQSSSINELFMDTKAMSKPAYRGHALKTEAGKDRHCTCKAICSQHSSPGRIRKCRLETHGSRYESIIMIVMIVTGPLAVWSSYRI